VQNSLCANIKESEQEIDGSNDKLVVEIESKDHESIEVIVIENLSQEDELCVSGSKQDQLPKEHVLDRTDAGATEIDGDRQRQEQNQISHMDEARRIRRRHPMHFKHRDQPKRFECAVEQRRHVEYRQVHIERATQR